MEAVICLWEGEQAAWTVGGEEQKGAREIEKLKGKVEAGEISAIRLR